jgi:hypothetical protein
MKFSPVHLLAALALLGLPACGIFDPHPQYHAADPMAVVPPEFLLSRYAPLNRWLDTPVRVQMYDVPLSQVTQQPCLRGINYSVKQVPSENPNVFIDKLALTRRQLLWSLSQDYQLHMSISFDATQGPACIEIRSRAARNDARARGDR